RRPGGYAALIVEQVVVFAVAGRYWTRARPGNRVGVLLYGAAIGAAVQGLQASPIPLVHTVAVLADLATAFCVFALLLGFPNGRIGRIGRASLGVLAIAIVAGFLPQALMRPELEGASPLAACAGTC